MHQAMPESCQCYCHHSVFSMLEYVSDRILSASMFTEATRNHMKLRHFALIKNQLTQCQQTEAARNHMKLRHIALITNQLYIYIYTIYIYIPIPMTGT